MQLHINGATREENTGRFSINSISEAENIHQEMDEGMYMIMKG